MSGSNAKLYVDGKELRGVRRISYVLDASGLPEITVTLMGQLEIEGSDL